MLSVSLKTFPICTLQKSYMLQLYLSLIFFIFLKFYIANVPLVINLFVLRLLIFYSLQYIIYLCIIYIYSTWQRSVCNIGNISHSGWDDIPHSFQPIDCRPQYTVHRHVDMALIHLTINGHKR